MKVPLKIVASSHFKHSNISVPPSRKFYLGVSIAGHARALFIDSGSDISLCPKSWAGSGVMEKLVISSDNVKKLLGNLNDTKSMGPDEIHPKLLKYLSNCDNFVIALTNLFNACISQECIPDIWKTAIVIPIHKKGSVHQPENYRPVSLTCVLCKMFETFLREHIIDYVSLVITEKQHGFLKGRSCLSNLLETIEKANEYMYEGNCVDILYFDFSKAFDTVPHHRLLVKLKAIGFSDNMLNIIGNFLSNRTMKVKVGDAVSREKIVLSGVPQGSVLGPILFLLFINDLPEAMSNVIKMFADDVKMIVNPAQLQSIQNDLKLLQEWEINWLLKFNIEKCKVLHMGKSNPNHKYPH